MNKQELLKLIDKYLNGTCTTAEKLLLNEYLDSFQQKENRWIESEMGNKQQLEEKLFAAIEKRIHSSEQTKLQRLLHSPASLRIAAAIAFFMLLTAATLYLSGVIQSPSPKLAWIEKATEMGEKTIITFNDGSKVTLNGGSKLRYPRNFGERQRDIYLTGEAYFEIAHDTSRPFIVYSDKISTRVLGTVFNVNAFPEDEDVTVSLIEGGVQVASEVSGSDNRTVILQPMQQLIFEKSAEVIRVDGFDLQKAVGWKENNLKFEKVSLGRILTALERSYGVKFELFDTTSRNRKYSANFNNVSIGTIAEVVKKLTGLKYRRVEEENELKKIVFYK